MKDKYLISFIQDDISRNKILYNNLPSICREIRLIHLLSLCIKYRPAVNRPIAIVMVTGPRNTAFIIPVHNSHKSLMLRFCVKNSSSFLIEILHLPIAVRPADLPIFRHLNLIKILRSGAVSQDLRDWLKGFNKASILCKEIPAQFIIFTGLSRHFFT